MTRTRASQKELTDDQQRFCVQLLACFRTPSEVAEALKKEFNLTVDRQRVEHYDPTKVAGQNLREDLKLLFEESRAAYLEQANSFGISHQVYRLDRLQELLVQASESGNSVEVRACLEQAAKELGGMYTNRRELTGAQGGPIQTAVMSLDDWKKQAAERREQAEATMMKFTEE